MGKSLSVAGLLQSITACIVIVLTVTLGLIAEADAGDAATTAAREFHLAGTLIVAFVLVGAVTTLFVVRPIVRRAAANNEAFRHLFELNPVPMFIYEQNGMRIVEGNDAGTTQYGYTREQFVAMSIADLLPPEDAWRIDDTHLVPHNGSLARIGLRRHRKADGSVFHVDILRHDLSFRGLNASLVTAIDVTAKVTAERELQGQKEHLARAQEISRTGSIDIDLATGAVSWSDEARRIFGVPPGAPIPGKDEFVALFHAEDRSTFLAKMRAAETGRSTDPVECRIVHADGTVRWLRNVSEAICDEHGRPWRRIATFQDVTELHEAQERQRQLEQSLRIARDAAEAARQEVQTANAELERRVEARSTELRAAQSELLKTERLSAIGQVTATVAHELRNPLSAIRNSAYSVRQLAALAGSAALEPALARIERSVQRCDRIVSELLDYTRARSLACETRIVDDWLGEMAGELAPLTACTIELDLHAGDSPARLDPERFRQVVLNLVENAAQALAAAAAPDKVPRIVLRTRLLERGIEIEIDDNGPGIPPENLDRVFEPLFTTKTIGTGLGLPMVKQIVEQHGGSIVLKSVVGQGTRASITLPLGEASIAA